MCAFIYYTLYITEYIYIYTEIELDYSPANGLRIIVLIS